MPTAHRHDPGDVVEGLRTMTGVGWSTTWPSSDCDPAPTKPPLIAPTVCPCPMPVEAGRTRTCKQSQARPAPLRMMNVAVRSPIGKTRRRGSGSRRCRREVDFMMATVERTMATAHAVRWSSISRKM